MSRQLPLRVGLPDHACFDNFYAGGNREAVEALRELASERPGVLYLYGSAGTGKSHLLHAAVRCAAEHDRLALYTSRDVAPVQEGEWLDLPAVDLMCIDGIDHALSAPEAAALFALYEHVRGAGGSLLVGARQAPAAVDWVLPDLRSRMHSALVYRLEGFGERDLEQALRLRAAHRGMALSDEVVRYVLRRYERSPASLFRLLDRIDTESLVRKQRVTIPLLRAMEADADDST